MPPSYTFVLEVTVSAVLKSFIVLVFILEYSSNIFEEFIYQTFIGLHMMAWDDTCSAFRQTQF